MTLCIYALGPGGARVSGKGIAGERLRVVRSGPLAAIVGESPHRSPPTAANLRAYDGVLQRFAALPSVLPARFMTCVADEEEVRFVLTSRRELLTAAMRQVRGRAQMTVRIVASPGGTPQVRARAVSTSAKPHLTATGGAAYLRARARDAEEERRAPEFEPLRAAVARWIRAEQVERRGAVVTVYHLIPRASAAAYQKALAAAAEAHGRRVVVSGPYLPFAFAGAAVNLGG